MSLVRVWQQKPAVYEFVSSMPYDSMPSDGENFLSEAASEGAPHAPVGSLKSGSNVSTPSIGSMRRGSISIEGRCFVGGLVAVGFWFI